MGSRRAGASNMRGRGVGDEEASSNNVVEPWARRALGLIDGGPIPDSFFDALPDDELARWDST